MIRVSGSWSLVPGLPFAIGRVRTWPASRARTIAPAPLLRSRGAAQTGVSVLEHVWKQLRSAATKDLLRDRSFTEASRRSTPGHLPGVEPRVPSLWPRLKFRRTSDQIVRTFRMKRVGSGCPASRFRLRTERFACFPIVAFPLHWRDPFAPQRWPFSRYPRSPGRWSRGGFASSPSRPPRSVLTALPSPGPWTRPALTTPRTSRARSARGGRSLAPGRLRRAAAGTMNRLKRRPLSQAPRRFQVGCASGLTFPAAAGRGTQHRRSARLAGTAVAARGGCLAGEERSAYRVPGRTPRRPRVSSHAPGSSLCWPGLSSPSSTLTQDSCSKLTHLLAFPLAKDTLFFRAFGFRSRRRGRWECLVELTEMDWWRQSGSRPAWSDPRQEDAA